MVCASVVLADTDERARELALPGALSFLRLRSGRPGLLPTVEQAASYPYAPHETAFVEQRLAQQAVGGPQTVQASLERLLDATGVDELMVTTMVPDPADRLRSFTRLAELPLRLGHHSPGSAVVQVDI
jgi:alkanesulfonate monooxygenase SsuD/methylene tetrahydromethanopterin reductase-like flavin-dependent oxidoreductase (luciferase family)